MGSIPVLLFLAVACTLAFGYHLPQNNAEQNPEFETLVAEIAKSLAEDDNAPEREVRSPLNDEEHGKGKGKGKGHEHLNLELGNLAVLPPLAAELEAADMSRPVRSPEEEGEEGGEGQGKGKGKGKKKGKKGKKGKGKKEEAELVGLEDSNAFAPELAQVLGRMERQAHDEHGKHGEHGKNVQMVDLARALAAETPQLAEMLKSVELSRPERSPVDSALESEQPTIAEANPELFSVGYDELAEEENNDREKREEDEGHKDKEHKGKDKGKWKCCGDGPLFNHTEADKEVYNECSKGAGKEGESKKEKREAEEGGQGGESGEGGDSAGGEKKHGKRGKHGKHGRHMKVCALDCVFKKKGLIDDKGEFNKAALKEELDKRIHEDWKKKLVDKHIEECINHPGPQHKGKGKKPEVPGTPAVAPEGASPPAGAPEGEGPPAGAPEGEGPPGGHGDKHGHPHCNPKPFDFICCMEKKVRKDCPPEHLKEGDQCKPMCGHHGKGRHGKNKHGKGKDDKKEEGDKSGSGE